jgi:hypothetical protein
MDDVWNNAQAELASFIEDTHDEEQRQHACSKSILTLVAVARGKRLGHRLCKAWRTAYPAASRLQFLSPTLWKVHRWRPSASLHEQFQNIGRAGYGEELLEHWNGDEDGWTDQEIFTESLPALPSLSEYAGWSSARRSHQEVAYSWAEYERRRRKPRQQDLLQRGCLLQRIEKVYN